MCVCVVDYIIIIIFCAGEDYIILIIIIFVLARLTFQQEIVQSFRSQE